MLWFIAPLSFALHMHAWLCNAVGCVANYTLHGAGGVLGVVVSTNRDVSSGIVAGMHNIIVWNTALGFSSMDQVANPA